MSTLCLAVIVSTITVIVMLNVFLILSVCQMLKRTDNDIDKWKPK